MNILMAEKKIKENRAQIEGEKRAAEAGRLENERGGRRANLRRNSQDGKANRSLSPSYFTPIF
jgi:hypothetical protein